MNVMDGGAMEAWRSMYNQPRNAQVSFIIAVMICVITYWTGAHFLPWLDAKRRARAERDRALHVVRARAVSRPSGGHEMDDQSYLIESIETSDSQNLKEEKILKEQNRFSIKVKSSVPTKQPATSGSHAAVIATASSKSGENSKVKEVLVASKEIRCGLDKPGTGVLPEKRAHALPKVPNGEDRRQASYVATSRRTSQDSIPTELIPSVRRGLVDPTGAARMALIEEQDRAFEAAALRDASAAATQRLPSVSPIDELVLPTAPQGAPASSNECLDIIPEEPEATEPGVISLCLRFHRGASTPTDDEAKKGNTLSVSKAGKRVSSASGSIITPTRVQRRFRGSDPVSGVAAVARSHLRSLDAAAAAPAGRPRSFLICVAGTPRRTIYDSKREGCDDYCGSLVSASLESKMVLDIIPEE